MHFFFQKEREKKISTYDLVCADEALGSCSQINSFVYACVSAPPSSPQRCGAAALPAFEAVLSAEASLSLSGAAAAAAAVAAVMTAAGGIRAGQRHG